MYSYRALSTDGKPQKGTLNAASETEAKAILKGRNVFPIDVRLSQSFRFDFAKWGALPRRTSFSPRVLANFTRQFGTLLHATIPYDVALGMIIQQSGDQKIKTVLSDIRGRVQEGMLLADALAQHPDHFSNLVVSMVRSGESSGSLGLVMMRLSDHFDNVARLRGRVGAALVYPAFMGAFGLAVVIFMVTFIIPRITMLMTNFGAQLPLPTRILIAFSDAITGYWWLILLVGGGLFVWLMKFLRTAKGRMLRDRAELKLPVWKTLRRKLILQRFTQTLATLLQSRVELKAALVISSEVMDNGVYRLGMAEVIDDVQNRGIPFAVALGRTGLVPDDICQMIDIGEKTANMETMLENVADRLSQEVTTTLEAATALFEPVMILVMGSIIGFMVISILLPLLQMNQLLR